MKLAIKRGRIARPQRIVIYAPEGLGKSTLASQFPEPLFLDFEGGTHHLDVARVEPKTLAETEPVLAELCRDRQGFGSLIIDTIDWLEELVIQAVCEDGKKTSIEDFGYGKGYTMLAERMGQVLTLLDGCAANGLHVVCLAHSHIRKFEQPDAAGAYDRYELKLTKQVGPLVKEWCDCLLFGNWKTKVAEKDNGKMKGIGGKERRLFCNHTAAWDAKNRHGLADEEPWNMDTMRRVLGSVAAPAKPEPIKEMTRAEKQADAIPDVPAPASEHPLEPILAEHEAKVNAFLIGRGEINYGQTFRDVSDAYVQRVLKNPAGFLNIACKEVLP